MTAGRFATNPQVALQLSAGVWTDISGYVLNRSAPAVTITRGRPDETSQVSPSQMTGQLNNRDGRFTSRNPLGPYYPDLTRNTPVRLSVPDQQTYLRIEDDTFSFCHCADSASLQITSILDVRIDLELSGYQACSLMSKWGSTALSWTLSLNNDGTLTLFWWTGSATQQASSTAPLPNLGRIAVRAYLNTASEVVFQTAPTMGGSWTGLGAAIALTTTLAAGVGQFVQVGGSNAGVQGLTGQVYEAQIYSSTTLVADPVFTAQTAGVSSFTDAQGNTWNPAFTATFDNRSYRYHGEMSSLPVAWDPSGHDIWVPFQASGILRRLSQGNANVWSPLKRAEILLPNIVAYWPCEDGTASIQLASGLPGGTPMSIAGVPQLSTDSSSFICSAALPYIESSSWTGQVPAYTATALVLRGLINVPASEPTGGSGLLLYATCGNAVGAVCTLWIGVNAGNIIATAGNYNGLSGNTVTGPAVGSGPIAISAEVYQSGGNYYLNLYWMTPGQP